MTHSRAFYGTLAEKMVSDVFGYKRMPFTNLGYDVLDEHGHTIDIKNSCLGAGGYTKCGWNYCIKCNKQPEYFILVALDGRKSLTPMHIWKVPGHIINQKKCLYISKTDHPQWDRYELPIAALRIAYEKWKENNGYDPKRYYYATV